MSVEIIKKDDEMYSVNNKHVYIDSEGKVVALAELTVSELHELSAYLKSTGKLV